MKLVITLDIDPGDMNPERLAARLRNRRGMVGEEVPKAAARAATNAAWMPLQDGSYVQPSVRRATSRIER